jgi:hypothetical protein
VTAHNLDEAMECLRKNHYSLCVVLKEAREDPAVVEEWRRAPRVLSGGGRRGSASRLCGCWRCQRASKLHCAKERGGRS